MRLKFVNLAVKLLSFLRCKHISFRLQVQLVFILVSGDLKGLRKKIKKSFSVHLVSTQRLTISGDASSGNNEISKRLGGA